MLNYIIFLRITPILPNWLINISSPILGVNIVHFFLGTFLGKSYQTKQECMLLILSNVMIMVSHTKHAK